jgi:hypothetical protein
MVALAFQRKWNIKHLDVKIVFLHGDPYEEIFMLQPKRFAQLGEEHKVCFLSKALYCLKQMSRVWYTKIDVFLLIIGLARNQFDHNLYFSMEGDWYVILILDVDDLFSIEDNTNRLKDP